MAPLNPESINPQGLRPDQMSTIKVTKYVDRSLPMFLLHHAIRPFRGLMITPKQTFPGGSQQLEPHKGVKNKIVTSERKVEDIYIYDIRPKKPGVRNVVAGEKKPSKRIYYFPGGGWQMPPSGEHWSFFAELATKLEDINLSVVSYPLAPDFPAPIAFPMLVKLYRTLMEEAHDAGEDVILAGDSSGGNIVLSLLCYTLHEDANANIEQPCPKAVLVISPSTDLRRQNIDMLAIAKKDPVLKLDFVNSTASKWRGDWSPTDVRISPLYADLGPIQKRGIKVHGVCGRYDILSPDAVLFREKCNQTWIEGEWLDWEKQMHVFPLAFSFKLPESVKGKDWILDVLQRC